MSAADAHRLLAERIGTGLPPVAPGEHSPRLLMRVMTMMGLNGWLTIYPSLHEALATGPAATSNAEPA